MTFPNHSYFLLKTQPKHLLKGIARHGIVRDHSGDLWLFQYGTGIGTAKASEEGDTPESSVDQLLAYPAARAMWSRMAERIRSKFAEREH